MYKALRTNRFISYVPAIVVISFFAFTPFYSLGYIIALFIATRHLGLSRIFSSAFSRYVLSAIILSITIMIAGTIAWLANVTIHPLLVLLLFALVCFVLTRLQTKDNRSSLLIDRGDIISLALALSSVIVMFIAFFVPNPTTTAAIQLLTNGIDGSAHLSLVRSSSIEKGYIYGTFEENQGKVMQDSGSYPQGWHLSASHLSSGFGSNPFTSNKSDVVIAAYLAVVSFWYTICIFVFSRISWQLLGRLVKKQEIRSYMSVALFVIANLLIQMLVFWPSFQLGFANYISCLLYIMIVAAMIIDRKDGPENDIAYLFAGSLAAIAVAQTWLLPTPAVIGMIALGFFVAKPLFSFKKVSFSNIAKQWRVVAVIATLIAGVGFQLGVLIAFSVTNPAEQLIARGGAAPLSNLLVFFIIAVAFYVWLQPKLSKSISNKIIAVTTPAIIFSGWLYIYQMFEVNSGGYYLAKLLGVVLCLTGLFFAPAAVKLVSKIPFPSPLRVSFLTLAGVAVLFVVTNQSTFAINKLFQSHTALKYGTARLIEREASKQSRGELLIMRGERLEEDVVGTYFYSRLTKQDAPCTNTFVLMGMPSYKNRLLTLEECAKQTDQTITVAVSEKTEQRVRDLNLPNLRIITLK